MRNGTWKFGAAAVIAVAIAGCGDDDATPPESRAAVDGGTSVVVGVDALRFDADAYQAAPGPISLELTNDGSLEHTLVVEDRESELKLTVSGSSRRDSGSIELGPGSYTIYCDVPGHRGAGMESELVVE